MSLESPDKITDSQYRYDSFENGKVLLNKKKNHLPAMGWNSWNAFGSGNTQFLTKIMADKIVELGLNDLGYKYVILDDGCYKAQRIDGKLSNDEVKFPDGFKTLSDYIHSKGLKFGMYNDIGTNLCAGAAVGTCGHEKTDAQSYIDWGVDFLKIDNCYFLWDNATFSNPENARYVFAPKIKGVEIKGPNNQLNQTMGTGINIKISAKDGKLSGNGAKLEQDYVTDLGTFDGTNTGISPIGPRSGELQFTITVAEAGIYKLTVEYASGKENGIGQWLQLAVGTGINCKYYYDDLLPETLDKNSFQISEEINIELTAGENIIRIMNHRRQENTLCSYAAMLEGLNKANPNHDILLSLCEWGKTQPQNWGYKVGDSWRILNDITFRVGSDGDAGFGEWNNPGTQSVCSQYNKAVVMDEFAGLDKGWNDPDMLMVGMKGLTPEMNKTHFTMWCMMNAPLMLGLDLRRVLKGDELYNIISNKDLIDLNQDVLGVQAKRIWTSYDSKAPDKDYIQDNNRFDILAKPLSDGGVAVALFNLSDTAASKSVSVSFDMINRMLGKKMKNKLDVTKEYKVKDLWSKAEKSVKGEFSFEAVPPCDCIVVKVY